jgi:predicted fused transcriptional regulator/phosphomethylpyrimidine kinase
MDNILVDVVLVVGLITHIGKKINIFGKIDCGMETFVSTLFVKHLDISLT